MCLFFPYESQLSQLILKNLILKFLKNMIKPLTNIFHSMVNFQMTLGLMKSNGCVPLLDILRKSL